jgi:hypothetical protein
MLRPYGGARVVCDMNNSVNMIWHDNKHVDIDS